MSIRINENIKAYRKALGITQSQLAEALGVTVGAVSKWESGLSNPDIELIVELADFFETSVDMLLGYEWRNLGMGKTIERLKGFVQEKKYDIGVKEADKALQKYPNCFGIIYFSADLFYTKGLEQKNQKDLQRAQELYSNSLNYIKQNEDKDINELTIQIRIGDIYMAMGKVDIAIKHLQKFNYCGINSDKIGFYLAQQEKTEEAFTYLSNSFLETFSSFVRVGLGFVDCYSTLKDYDTAIDCLLFLKSFVQGLKKTAKPSYLDKLTAVLLTTIAMLYDSKEQRELSIQYLEEAVAMAQSFDLNPEFNCTNMKFYHGETQPIYDDMGESAMLAIENSLQKYSKEQNELIYYFKEIKETKNETKHKTIQT